MVINYTTASLAKVKGFDIPTFGYYIKLHTGWQLQFEDKELGAYNWNERKAVSAPEQYDLQVWLLRNHNLYIEVKYMNFGNDIQKGFYYTIYSVTGIYWSEGIYGKDLFSGYDSYEECLEFALCQSLLKLK
jgi:hypothetical protein